MKTPLGERESVREKERNEVYSGKRKMISFIKEKEKRVRE